MNPSLDRDKLGRGCCVACWLLVVNPPLDRDKLGRGRIDLETTNQSSALLKKYRGQLGNTSVLVHYQIRQYAMGRNIASSRRNGSPPSSPRGKLGLVTNRRHPRNPVTASRTSHARLRVHLGGSPDWSLPADTPHNPFTASRASHAPLQVHLGGSLDWVLLSFDHRRKRPQLLVVL